MKSPDFLNDLDNPKFCEDLGHSFKDDPIDCYDAPSMMCFKKAYFVGVISGWDPVLITGDNGVGKTGYAKLLWHLNKKKKIKGDGKFVAINCAAMTPTLLESTLFGYKKGAFSGASTDKEGVLMHAAKEKGCIFLDEFGELSLEAQAKLLRVFQHKKIQPVGSNEEEDLGDLKIICATNKNLEEEIQDGRFRRDLFNRVNKYHIDVPALKLRPKDCAYNVRKFLQDYVEKLDGEEWANGLKIDSSFDKDNTESGYPWPGNFRELQNRLYQAIVRNVINQKFTIGFYDLLTREDVVRERKNENAEIVDGNTAIGFDLGKFGFQPLSNNIRKFDLVSALNKLESAYVDAMKKQTNTLSEAAEKLGYNCYQTMERRLKK